MEPGRVIVVLTQSERGESIWAATPLPKHKHRVRRCHLPEGGGPAATQEHAGSLLSVKAAPVGIELDRMVRCGSTAFECIGDAAQLSPGCRVAIGGGDGSSVHVVSSPIREVHALDPDRSWAIEPMLRAFRNGDPDWRELLVEDPTTELGDEGITDDETGSISVNAIEKFYRRRLAKTAASRIASARRRGFHLEPRHVLLSNEDLGTALAAGAIEGVAAVPAGQRAAAACGIDAMLATILASDLPLPARVVVVKQADLEAAILAAPGSGMKALDLEKRAIKDRRVSGRVAEGIDRMLRTVKAWPEPAPAELPAAA
ncbi:MAG: hypothetical protein U0166_03125 [Acidobacteriota bacterium]